MPMEKIREGRYSLWDWILSRSKRQRPPRQRRVKPPHPFVRFIRDLFRGGPNPFLASPIATLIDRNIGLEKYARTHASGGDKTARLLEKQIRPELKEYLSESARETDAVLDQLDVDANNKETDLDRLSPKRIKTDLEAALDKIKGHVESNLGPRVRTLAREESELETFEEDHCLNEGKAPHWGQPLARDALPFILGVTIGEFLLNTAFFSGSMPGGMIESAGLAAMLSVVTIALGIFLGWSCQYLDRRSHGKGWIGATGLLVASLSTFFYLLLLTLARNAGDRGELRMFEVASREILVTPFAGMLDVPALAYFIFSVAVIVFIARKFLSIMGDFPKLRSYKLAVADAEREFDECRLGMIEAFERRIDEHSGRLDDLPDKLQILELFLKELVIDYENAIDQMREDVHEVIDARDLLVEVAQRYVDTPTEAFMPKIGYDAKLGEYTARLENYQKRIDALLRLADIGSESIETCRDEIAILAKEKREAFDEEIEDLLAKSEAHFRRTARKPRRVKDDPKVAWLSKERA